MVGQATTPAQANWQQTGKAKVYTPKTEGLLLDQNGELHELTPTPTKALLSGGVEPIMYVEIDKEQLPVWKTDTGGDAYIKTTMPTVNDCVYRAIKKFVEALGLGSLTPGDEKFFKTHPRVNSDGVAKANVLAVSHGLVVPWGLGITRVWVPRLSSLGEQHLEFARALGMNPKAMVDYSTSNAELLKLLEIDEYSQQAMEINEAFRFEFVDTPPGPCIVMLSNYGSSAKKTGGVTVQGQWSSTVAGMGHADFVGPRDALYGNWQIAFRIGRLPVYADDGAINRYRDVELAFDADELKTKTDSLRTFSVWNSVVGGKTINTWDNMTRQGRPAGTTPPTKAAKTTAKPQTAPKNGKDTDKVQIVPRAKTAPEMIPCPDCGGMTTIVDGITYCLSCNWYVDSEEKEAGVKEVCPICYTTMDDDGETCLNKDCGFVQSEWDESTYFVCSIHGIPLMFRRDKGDKTSYTYVCPDCMFVEDVALGRYEADDRSHSKEHTTQIREFVKTGGDSDGD